MSAPRTNIDKQKRRHRGPLIGMALVVVLVIAGFSYWLVDEAADGQSPVDTQSQP